MQRLTNLCLSGALVMLGVTALTANVKAQTTLDRDASAPGSDRAYLQLVGLEGPSLRPLKRVSRQCQPGCAVPVSGAETHEGRASARDGKATPASGGSGKSLASCAPPK